MSRTIVCDTGPLLHLSEAGAIHLLEDAGGILIPPAVAVEYRRNSPRQKLPAWIEVRDVAPAAEEAISEWVAKGIVDAGEAQAIGLAMQVKSEWFLTDDTQARTFAESIGLEVHGSIGVLLWAVAAGHLHNRSEAHNLLNGLIGSSLWISERVAHEAALAIHDLLAK